MSSFDRYLRAVLGRAEREARGDGSPTIEAGHLLLAIAGEGHADTRRVLEPAGLDRDAVRAALDREFEHSLSAVGVSRAAHTLPRPSGRPGHPGLGTSAKLALERGFAAVPRKKDLRPAHLLLGVLTAEVGTVPRALALAGSDRTTLLGAAQQALTTDTT
jgi:ATP-dependent Clp protease ATP-binding subunit ClpA